MKWYLVRSPGEVRGEPAFFINLSGKDWGRKPFLTEFLHHAIKIKRISKLGSVREIWSLDPDKMKLEKLKL